MDRPDARPAVARSAAAAGRHHLVERAVHQPRRQPRSAHQRNAGVQARDRRPPAQHRGRCGGKHLVHGERQRDDREAGAEDRRDHRLQDAGSGRARSAHGHLRQERHAVLHAPAEQHDRTAGAVDRRHQADHPADAARAPLRHQAELAGHAVGVVQRVEQARQHRSGHDGGPRARVARRGNAVATAWRSPATTPCGSSTRRWDASDG